MLDTLRSHNLFRCSGLEATPLVHGIEIPARQRDLIPRSCFSADGVIGGIPLKDS